MITLKEKTIGKAEVIIDIVDKGNFEIRPGYEMKPSETAIHNTGNKGRGANAKAHNTYIHNMSELPATATGYASWHFSVDAYFIYQHIPLDESAWHTGDGDGLNSGNRNAIGIEICENSDMTPEEYAQAEENAVELAALLMKMFNIPIQKNKPHQAYSGKYCPHVILTRDGSFAKFNDRINKAYKKNEITLASNPVKENTTMKYLQNGDSGTVVKDLQMRLIAAGYKIDVDGSFGPATENAVKAFQKANKLTVDGFYGPATKAKLEANIKPKAVVKPKPVAKKVLYKVQVGAFADKANAERLAKELKGKGYSVYIVEV